MIVIVSVYVSPVDDAGAHRRDDLEEAGGDVAVAEGGDDVREQAVARFVPRRVERGREQGERQRAALRSRVPAAGVDEAGDLRLVLGRVRRALHWLDAVLRE